MASQYKTKGFIYKKLNRGEADKIFTIFTYDFGKIDIFAKSIRKIDSKLKSGIDIFYLSDIEFVQGKRKTLTDANLINKFPEITKVPEKFIIAKKIAKVLEAFIYGQEHDHEIFNLIIDIFNKLNSLVSFPRTRESRVRELISGSQIKSGMTNDETDKLQLLFLLFLWNFFAILGYTPQLSNCAHCHKQLNEKELYFSNKDGGVICKNCYTAYTLDSRFRGNDIAVNSDTIKILRIILEQNWEILKKLKINIETQKELNNISKNYYLYLLSSHYLKKL